MDSKSQDKMINMFLNIKYAHVRNSCTCFIYHFVVSNQFTGVRRRQMKYVMLLCKIQIKKSAMIDIWWPPEKKLFGRFPRKKMVPMRISFITIQYWCPTTTETWKWHVSNYVHITKMNFDFFHFFSAFFKKKKSFYIETTFILEA